MLKFLVMGGAGMAGHVVATYLEERGCYDVRNLSHRKKLNSKSILMDITNLSDLNYYLDSTHFDVIINCIGILNRDAEENKDKAVFINSYIPHFLEYKYINTKTKIIHLSTDCVFSGKTGGYLENSLKDGETFYDMTKSVGEIINGKDLTFRMSIIGPDLNYDGIGLFNWFMKSEGEINGYTGAIWTGVTTVELAKAIEAAAVSDLTGLYHLVNGDSISKYELLKLFKSHFNRNNIAIKEYGNLYINKSLINTRNDFNFKIPSYAYMVKEMKDWVDRHKELYPHYFQENYHP